MLKIISKTNQYVKILETKDNGKLRIRRTISTEEYNTMAAKADLLVTVDQLNETFPEYVKPQLRLKSKTAPLIVQALNAALAAIPTEELYINAPDDMLDTMATHGVDIPDPPTKKQLKKYKKKHKAMSAIVVVNEDEEANEPPTKEEQEEEKVPEPMLTTKEEKKLRKIIANKKGKYSDKKVSKAINKLAELEEPKPKPKAKTAPRKGAAARASRTVPDKITWPKAGTITATIIKAAHGKPVTLEKILKKLSKKFPDRPTSGMNKTLQALVGGKGVPLPLTYTKGIQFEVFDDGTPERTIQCTSDLPEDY